MCSQMSMNCTMSVIMSYYKSLALWESLIEPTENSTNGKHNVVRIENESNFSILPIISNKYLLD